jgi:hypothetical protein
LECRRRIRFITSNQAVPAMSNKHFVYAYDSEPAIDRTTGFPRFDQSTLTAPAAWNASEHSTFDEPSRSIDRVQAHRTRRENGRVITMVLIAVTAVCAAVVAVMR